MTPEDLVEIEAIKRLKYRYLRHLDLKEWDELAGCFTSRATASYGGGAYVFEGRDAIMDFLRRSMDSRAMLTSHKVHHPEIELTASNAATGVWALEDTVLHTELGVTIGGAAFYRDEYVKVGGEWLIRHTGYKRVYEELQPRSADARLTASWWDTDGKTHIPAP
jgi:bile-acid 7alpha-dehydratase